MMSQNSGKLAFMREIYVMKIEKINVEIFLCENGIRKTAPKIWFLRYNLNFLKKFNKPGTNVRAYMKQLLLDLNQ